MNPPAGYEERDARPGVIAAVGLGLAVAVALLGTAVDLGVRHDRGASAREAELRRQTSFRAAPARQRPILADRDQARQEATAQLHAAGWVDQRAGVARIPVEQAMRLLVEAEERGENGSRGGKAAGP